MDISACIITYNQRPHIEKAIEGALSQKFSAETRYEIVISDDCSNDGTSEICIDYARRFDKIRYVRLSENNGATFNFRRTLGICQGRYIAICEGDDYWIDNYKLDRQIIFLDANPGIGLVHTDAHILHPGAKLERDFYHSRESVPTEEGDLSLRIMRHEYGIFTCTACLRREVISLYLSDLTYESFMMGDTPLWIEAAKHYGVKFLPFTSAVRRLSAGSLSFSALDGKQIVFFESGISCLKYLQTKYGYPDEEFNELFRLGYLQVLKASLLADDRKAFIKHSASLKSIPGMGGFRAGIFSAIDILSGSKLVWRGSVVIARVIWKCKSVF